MSFFLFLLISITYYLKTLKLNKLQQIIDYLLSLIHSITGLNHNRIKVFETNLAIIIAVSLLQHQS